MKQLMCLANVLTLGPVSCDVGCSLNTITITEISKVFSEFAKADNITVSCNFIELSLEAMKYLKLCGRSNVLDSLARGLGTKRQDGEDSLFPAKRMPMGLLEYMANFYAAEKLPSVSGLFYQLATMHAHNTGTMSS